MLRSFVYLNEDRLDEYIGQVEGGLRQISRRTATEDHSKAGAADLKLVKGDLSTTRGSSQTEELADSGPARFARLLDLVAGHEDDFGWIEVLSDADLEGIRPGSMIDVSADLYESDVTKMTGPSGVLGMLPMLSQMQSSFGGAASSSSKMPDASKIEALRAFATVMPELILLGDIDGSETRIVCVLPATMGAEGQARVVAKVKKVVAPGKYEPLPGLPFLDQMPRAQRRDFLAKGMQAGQEMMWIEGPALVLDVLAIWR
nr:hypothetical protein [Microbacterium testaceum]